MGNFTDLNPYVVTACATMLYVLYLLAARWYAGRIYNHDELRKYLSRIWRNNHVAQVLIGLVGLAAFIVGAADKITIPTFLMTYVVATAKANVALRTGVGGLYRNWEDTEQFIGLFGEYKPAVDKATVEAHIYSIVATVAIALCVAFFFECQVTSLPA